MRYSIVSSDKDFSSFDCPVVAFFDKAGVKSSSYWSQLLKTDQDYLTMLTSKKHGSSVQMILLPESRKHVILVRLGDKKSFNERALVRISRRIMRFVKDEGINSYVVSLNDFQAGHLSERVIEVMSEAFEMACYDFVSFKEAPKDGWHDVARVGFFTKEKSKNLSRSLETGALVGEMINRVRELSNTPGGDMTPTGLASAAVTICEEVGVSTSILTEKEMEELNMGGMLGVSRGSVEEAKLIVMEYYGGKKDKAPIVFVGKGITFDSGGLNLKPGRSMEEMHMDMNGGAAVIGAVAVAAKLKLPVNIVGIVPSVENMPSGQSYRPGDILKSMSGKTIEVVDTDAEGRVILADALTYAERYNPALVLDVATLTGAACVALGKYASAYMTRNDDVAKLIDEAGEMGHDYVWRLPLWDEYEGEVKGQTGDIANASRGRDGGAINGGMFLYQFAKKFPRWAHIDIAPTMTSGPDQYLCKGASGSGMRLLVQVARSFRGK